MDILTPIEPFDFSKMLERPLSRPSKVTVIDAETSSFTRAMRLNARVIPITITGKGTVERPLLQLVYPQVHDHERTEIHQKIKHMFSTHVNLVDFYALVTPDVAWRPLLKPLYGLRPIQDADLFESMVKIIIGQQLNVQFAATLVERLVDLGEERVTWGGRFLPVFPSPEQVANWSYDQLRERSFSQRKAEYVIDFARSVVDGKVDLESLRQMPDEQVYEQLIPLRGIGRWTVECFLLFGIGRQDIIPAADIGVQNALQKLTGMEYRPREEEVRHITAKWAPFRSFVTYYLWQSLIQEKQNA